MPESFRNGVHWSKKEGNDTQYKRALARRCGGDRRRLTPWRRPAKAFYLKIDFRESPIESLTVM